eukprot:2843480-Rhodomonas_salina.1
MFTRSVHTEDHAGALVSQAARQGPEVSYVGGVPQTSCPPDPRWCTGLRKEIWIHDIPGWYLETSHSEILSRLNGRRGLVPPPG